MAMLVLPGVFNGPGSVCEALTAKAIDRVRQESELLFMAEVWDQE